MNNSINEIVKILKLDLNNAESQIYACERNNRLIELKDGSLKNEHDIDNLNPIFWRGYKSALKTYISYIEDNFE